MKGWFMVQSRSNLLPKSLNVSVRRSSRTVVGIPDDLELAPLVSGRGGRGCGIPIHATQALAVDGNVAHRGETLGGGASWVDRKGLVVQDAVLTLGIMRDAAQVVGGELNGLNAAVPLDDEHAGDRRDVFGCLEAELHPELGRLDDVAIAGRAAVALGNLEESGGRNSRVEGDAVGVIRAHELGFLGLGDHSTGNLGDSAALQTAHGTASAGSGKSGIREIFLRIALMTEKRHG